MAKKTTMGQLASQFLAASRKAKPALKKDLEQFAQVGVGLVKREIQSMHAVDTGAMVNSTTAERVNEDTYMVGPTVQYAPYVALGTSRMAARPFHTEAARKLADQRRKHWQDYDGKLGL